jgi:hypothetical protein
VPSGLESLWTYVDPSTTQGVVGGVVLVGVAIGILVVYRILGRWAAEEVAVQHRGSQSLNPEQGPGSDEGQ